MSMYNQSQQSSIPSPSPRPCIWFDLLDISWLVQMVNSCLAIETFMGSSSSTRVVEYEL